MDRSLVRLDREQHHDAELVDQGPADVHDVSSSKRHGVPVSRPVNAELRVLLQRALEQHTPPALPVPAELPKRVHW
jgi:hypothetical protein